MYNIKTKPYLTKASNRWSDSKQTWNNIVIFIKRPSRKKHNNTLYFLEKTNADQLVYKDHPWEYIWYIYKIGFCSQVVFIQRDSFRDSA